MYKLPLQNLKNLYFHRHQKNFLFYRFQKALQADGLTVLGLMKKTIRFKKRILTMKDGPVVGRQEEHVTTKLKIKGGFTYYKGISVRNSNASNNHQTMRDSILSKFTELLETRFNDDLDLGNILANFVDFDRECDIKRVHTLIAGDMPFHNFSEEYSDLALNDHFKKLSLDQKIKDLSTCENMYNHVLTALARITTLKPHSADVERLISINNLFKSPLRSNIDITYKNVLLYIIYNMPNLEDFDPRPAVKLFFDGNRRVKKQKKARSQKHFKGIFNNAGRGNLIDDMEESGEEDE